MIDPREDNRSIRAITFDAGGTLLYPHPSAGTVYREVALRHGIDRGAEELDQSFKVAFATVSKDASVLDPEARERDFWQRVVYQTFAGTNGDPLDQDHLARIFEDAWETFSHGSRWRLFPAAVSTLKSLKAKGYQLAIISNWDHRIYTVLEETGLRALFDAVIVSSEAGAEKPDTGIFRFAESALGRNAAECLHVGDSRKHDIEGAEAAGWRSVLVRHDGSGANGGEVGDLSDLVEILR